MHRTPFSRQKKEKRFFTALSSIERSNSNCHLYHKKHKVNTGSLSAGALIPIYICLQTFIPFTPGIIGFSIPL